MLHSFGRCKFAFVVLLAAGQLFAGKEFLAGPREQTVADQLLVGLLPGGNINQVISGLAPQAVTSVLSGGHNTYLLKLQAGTQASVSRLVAANPAVNYVEPNRIRATTVAPPNDSMLTQQWNLTTIQAQQAWSYFPDQYLTSYTANTNRVKVAILDSGVDCTHPDFMNAGGSSTNTSQGGQLNWASSSAIQATTISPAACPWEDDNGHGTHVAGIVAAATNNGTGIASLGYSLQLVVIKTSDQNGNATDFQIGQAITAAIGAGAQVICLSLGNAGYSQTLQTALDTAWQNNILVVAAAGDTGDTTLIYPGAGNHVLGVGATDNTNTVASFSTYGEWVRIAAPGVNVLSTLPTYGSSLGSNYGSLQGTSMAAPHVAALGGLLFAANPGISVAAVAQRIQETAQSPSPEWNQYIGYGVINAAAALGNIPGSFTQGALTGQVVDSSNNPITGAVVTAGTQSYTTALDPITGSENGLFRLNLPPGSYPIAVAASGHSSVNVQGVVVAGADTMMTIQMDVPLGEFTGLVTYNGVGVAGAAVEAVSGGLIVGTAVTDSSGHYTLYLPQGTYTLTASAPNYIDATSGSQSLTANGSIDVNLPLTALGTIFGTVTDVNGLPVANARIDLSGGSITGGALTGPTGTFSTTGLPSGLYTVTASASGYTPVTINAVYVINNVSTPVSLQFSTGIALSNGLLGDWPLDEGSGNIAYDLSGNLYKATLTNTTWTTGLLFRYALLFSEPAGSFGLTPLIPIANGFSVSVWVNSAIPENSSGGILQTSSTPGWFLGVDSTGTTYKFIVNGAAGSTGTCGFQSGCVQGGTVTSGWHMVTATYDGFTAILYVDGVRVASDTFTNGSLSSTLELGWNWSGVMEDLLLYNRALNALEVSSLYLQGSTANLGLQMMTDFATVPAGSAIGYTLVASNAGPVAAGSATVTDALPSGAGISWTISPAYNGPGSCSIANGTLTCSLGNLPAGSSAQVHIASATTAASCGAYYNTASVSASNAATVQASSGTTVTCGQTISFAPLWDQVYGTRPYALYATASSNLQVSFASLSPSVCTVSGTTVTLVGGGTCTIQATQGGNWIYSAATPVNQSFNVAPEGQTISFQPMPSQVFGTPINLSATASSGLAVTFSSQTPAVCSVSGNAVTQVTVGICTVQATQPGNASWSAATPVNQSFSITQGSQSITFVSVAGQAYGGAPFNVNATASSGLPVTLSSQTPSVCTLSGSAVTLVSVGTCAIQASQSGNANWASASPVVQSFSVSQGNQTIIFVPLPNQAYGAVPFFVSATATSGLAVTFTSQTAPVCTVSGTTVTLVGVGTCTIQATQTGNTSWSSAPAVNQSFTVSQGSQTITFGSLQSHAYGSVSFPVSAAASSGLPVSFTSQTTSVCTVSGSTVSMIAVGACTIQATQAGSINWAPAATVSQGFQVTQGSQTITFGTLQSQAYGTAPFPVSATASSGLTVSFTSQTTSICTVSGSTVTLVAAGVCTIQAAQAGDTNWNAAPAVVQGFAVTQGNQTIAFGALTNQTYGAAPFAVSATASSGLSVSFASQTASICTVSGSTVTLAAVGTCTVQANQAGNGNWAAATPVNQNFSVTQGSQTITFGALQSQAFGTAPLTVSATASSGLPVSFSSQTTPVCTVSGSTVTLVAVGTCTIQAAQSGTTNWLAATAVNQSFAVTQGSQTITFGAPSSQAFGTGPLPMSATASSGLPVSFTSQTASVCTVSGSTVTLVAVGTCTIQATQSGNTNWAAAAAVGRSFSVTQGTQTITFESLQNQMFGAGAVALNATASSALPVSFSSQTPSACTISGNSVVLAGVGTCTVQGTQGGNTNWSAAAPVSQSFAVSQGTQTITFGPLQSQAFGSGPMPLSATANSGLAVSLASQTTSVCTVSGSAVTLAAVGNCTIQATQAGTTNWSPATPVTQSFAVTSGSQTISFGSLPAQAFGAGPLPLSATASSGLAVSFSSQTSSVCTVASSTVTLVAVGTCTIQAAQGGNANWSAAAPVNQSFPVTQGSQTIAFAPLQNQAYGSGPFAVSATASSGLAIGFNSQTTSVCTMTGSTVTPIAVGSCTIQAVQGGNSNWATAAPVSQSFTVTQGSQTIAFAPLSSQAFGAGTFAVSATASSGLPVAFTSQTASVCAVSGNTVTLAAVGTCTIQATQAGNANWIAAASVSQSFAVTPGGQTITFASAPSQAFGSGPIALSASASSGLPVSFTAQTTSVCTVSGSMVALVSVGTCTIQATQGGNANFTAATPVSQTFAVTQGSQTIAFASLSSQPFGSGPVAVSATASSGLAVSLASQTTSVCTVAGNSVTLVAVGTCTIQATQGGNLNWSAAAPVTQSFAVTAGAQTITFASLQSEPYGSGPVTVSATASSGLAVTLASQTTSICTIAGNSVSLVAVGTCTIQATQAGNTNWSAASPVSQSFSVTPGSQTITFGSLQIQEFGVGTMSVSATATSGLPVSFSSLTATICSVSGATVTTMGAGTCIVQATQPGNANWAAATPVTQSFVVTQGTQTIAFGALQGQAYGAGSVTVSAVASSGLPVTFSSQTSTFCTVAGTTVNFVAVGTCTIQATQSGNANWSAATPVTQSFAIAQGSQTIAFGALANQAYGSAPFHIGATASSGLAVSFTSQTSTVCTVSGGTVTLLSGGACTIQATQAGNTNWSAAATVSQTFTVTATNQTISFASLSNQVYGAMPFPLSATASSGLPVSFNSQTGTVCTLSGSTAIVISAGTCTIQATQEGNSSYTPAPFVSQSFTVSQANQSIAFGAIASQPYGTAPFALSATATSGLPVSFASQTTGVCTVSGGTVTLAAVGLCTVQATQAGNTNYNAAPSASQSFPVTQTAQTITFGMLSDQPFGKAPFAIAATSSAGLTVIFSSQTTSACTVSGSTVTLAAIGTCTIQATQTGNADYSAAAAVSQSFTVTSGVATASVTGLNFPNTIVGKPSTAQTFTLQNKGNMALTITAIGMTGADTSSYRYNADAVQPCPMSPSTLLAGASCVLDVVFAPATQGAHDNAQIVITDNSGNVPGTTQSIGLLGMGIVLSSIAVNAGSPSIVYGSTEQFTATGTYSDNSTADLTSQATWASSATGVATISGSGLATSVSAGQTNITATFSGVTSNTFQLTVLAGNPASIAVFSGSGQSATVGTQFASQLQAAVKDSGGNPVPNASVTFTAPSNGASATFANNMTTYTVATNSSGIATSPALTANATAGSYAVTAGTTGVSGVASFSLTNVKAAVLTIGETAPSALVQGQTASYLVTVGNMASAGPTSGTVTMTESVPSGLTLTGMSGGATWNCNSFTATCSTNLGVVLTPGSTSSITVTFAVSYSVQGSVSNSVSASGGGSQTASYSVSTPVYSACDLNLEGKTTIEDLQEMINEVLGVSSPQHDLNSDGTVNVVDLEILMNAALHMTCSAS